MSHFLPHTSEKRVIDKDLYPIENGVSSSVKTEVFVSTSRLVTDSNGRGIPAWEKAGRTLRRGGAGWRFETLSQGLRAGSSWSPGAFLHHRGETQAQLFWFLFFSFFFLFWAGSVQAAQNRTSHRSFVWHPGRSWSPRPWTRQLGQSQLPWTAWRSALEPLGCRRTPSQSHNGQQREEMKVRSAS